MRIDEADALGIKGMSLNHAPYFAHLRYFHFQECIELCERTRPVMKRAESQLSHDRRVHEDLSTAESFLHLWIAVPKMINPDRCVGENHSS